MDSFGNCIYRDNPAARDNIAKPIRTTLHSARFLSEKEFLHGVVDENNNHKANPYEREEHVENIYDGQVISSTQSQSTSTDLNDAGEINPEGGDTLQHDKGKGGSKWISECLDTIEVMKTVKICNKREIQKCLEELEDIVVNSDRNFTTHIIRSKRVISELFSTPKKSDPNREMKQIQINKYLKSVSLSVKTANRIAQDQIHYLRFIHKFTTYLVRKGDGKLFLDCEKNIIEMNQTLATLASEAMTRRLIDMECAMAEIATYFGDNILQTTTNWACILKAEKDKFLDDINDSSSDLMNTVRQEFQNQDSLRQKNKEKIQETITRLQNKYQTLGKNSVNVVTAQEIDEYAKQADDLYVSMKVSVNPKEQAHDNTDDQAVPDVQTSGSKDCFTYPRSKDPTKKTSLQPLLRKLTRHLTALLQSLSSANKVVLHNFHLYSTEAVSNYQTKLKDYRREYMEDFKHENNEILEHLLRHVKKMSPEKHGFTSPLDIMDMEHPDYPHLKERVIDTYVLHIKSIHSNTVSFIFRFTEKFGSTLDKCLKLQYKLLKHNSNSQVNMNLLRYQNVLLFITLLRAFHNHVQKQIMKVSSILQEISNRMQLPVISEFQMHIEHFELQSAILTNAFTLALQELVEKYYHFVEKCWKISREMGQRDISNLKGTLKQVYEVVQDFAITQPIILSKKEGTKIMQNESSNGAIDGFLTRRFSRIHETTAPFSILKVPGLLRSILKRNEEDSTESLINEDENIEGSNEGAKEASVVWTGAKPKFKVRFDEFEDGGDGNNTEEEQPNADAKITPKNESSCSEEIHENMII